MIGELGEVLWQRNTRKLFDSGMHFRKILFSNWASNANLAQPAGSGIVGFLKSLQKSCFSRKSTAGIYFHFYENR